MENYNGRRHDLEEEEMIVEGSKKGTQG